MHRTVSQWGFSPWHYVYCSTLVTSTTAVCLSSAATCERRQTESMALWPVKQLFELVLRSCLFLLQEIIVALSNTPAIRDRHGRTLGTTRGWLQVLPVFTTCSTRDNKQFSYELALRVCWKTVFQYIEGCYWPGSDPGLSVHLQTSTPAAVFLWCSWEEASLMGQFLWDSPDVIRFKSTAATNVSNASIVGLSSVFVHVPASQDPWLQTWQKSLF